MFCPVVRVKNVCSEGALRSTAGSHSCMRGTRSTGALWPCSLPTIGQTENRGVIGCVAHNVGFDRQDLVPLKLRSHLIQSLQHDLQVYSCYIHAWDTTGLPHQQTTKPSCVLVENNRAVSIRNRVRHNRCWRGRARAHNGNDAVKPTSSSEDTHWCHKNS